jgi:hypothetical protein
VKEKVQDYSGAEIWIGFRVRTEDEESTFSWSDNSIVNNFAKFWVGGKEPVKGCAAMIPNNR